MLNVYGFIRWIFVAVFLGLVLGCTSVNHKVGDMFNLATNLKLEIIADEEINPDEQNNPSPVFVRLYELNSTAAFERADFIDIYERDEEVLGASLIAKQELKRIVPNTFREEDFVLSEDTKYVALFAEFYNYENSSAKVVFEVTESNVIKNTVGIQILDNRIQRVKVTHSSNKKNKKKSKTYHVERE